MPSFREWQRPALTFARVILGMRIGDRSASNWCRSAGRAMTGALSTKARHLRSGNVLASATSPEERVLPNREEDMKRDFRSLAIAVVALVLMAGAADAQKRGGILKTYDPDSPGGMSPQEEAT